jgi:hypothetical protein
MVDPPPQLRDIPEHIIDTSMAQGVELQQREQEQQRQQRVEPMHTPTISIRMHTPNNFVLRYLHKHDHDDRRTLTQ